MDGRRVLHVAYYLPFGVFGTPYNAENVCQVFTFDEDYPEVYFNYFNFTSLSFFAPRLEKCIFHLYGKLN